MNTRRVVHSKFVIAALALAFVAGFVVFTGECTDQAYAAATTWYVDSGAAAGGNGTIGTPWDSSDDVEAAQTGGQIHAGDTVLFKRGGTYPGNLTVTVTGTAGSYLTFDAYGTGAKPIIDGTGQSYTIVFASMNYLAFKNLNIKSGTLDTFRFRTANDHITIENVDMTDANAAVNPTALEMVAGAGTFTNISIINCTTDGTFARPLYFLNMTTLSDVIIQGGTYSNSLTSGIAIVGPAATASNITISGVTVDGAVGSGISLTTVSNVVISGTTTTDNTGSGLSITGNSNTIDIDGLTSTGNLGSGITISGSTSVSGVTVDDSAFNSNGDVAGDNGVSVLGTTDNIIFTSSTMNNNYGDGFNVHDASTNIICDQCTANENGLSGAAGAGDAYSYHDTTTGVIRNSIAANNYKTAIAHINTSSVNMYNNIFTHATNGTLSLVYLGGGTHILRNNVIYSPGHVGMGLDVTAGTATVQNNIIDGFNYGFYEEGAPTLTADYNLVYGAAIENYHTAEAGAHDLNTDPKFVTPGTDFHLQSTSPAIDSGLDVSISTDYAGKQRYDMPGATNTGSGAVTYYDRGAYEYATPPIPTIASSTHPSQAGWYKSNVPSISVDPTSSTTSYHYLINQVASPASTAVQAGTSNASGSFIVPDGDINADGVWYIHVVSQNMDGDFSSDYSTYTIRYDHTAPTISAVIDPPVPNGESGSYATRPDITLSAADATSGVANIVYNWDLGPNQAYSSHLQAQEGRHTLYFYAADQAGNLSATSSTNITVDSSSPIDFVATARSSTGSSGSLEASVPSPTSIISEPLGGAYSTVTTTSPEAQQPAGRKGVTVWLVSGGGLLVVAFGLWKLWLRRFW